MESVIIFVHVIAAIAITGLVLIQQGKGADMGASFGSGASQTIFGSSGSGNVLSKSTSIMAVVFFYNQPWTCRRSQAAGQYECSGQWAD